MDNLKNNEQPEDLDLDFDKPFLLYGEDDLDLSGSQVIALDDDYSQESTASLLADDVPGLGEKLLINDLNDPKAMNKNNALTKLSQLIGSGEYGEDADGTYIIKDGTKYYIKINLFNPKTPTKADYVAPPHDPYYVWEFNYSPSDYSSNTKTIKSNLFYYNLEDAEADLQKAINNAATVSGRRAIPNSCYVGRWRRGFSEWYVYEYVNSALIRKSVYPTLAINWRKFAQAVISVLVLAAAVGSLYLLK